MLYYWKDGSVAGSTVRTLPGICLAQGEPQSQILFNTKQRKISSESRMMTYTPTCGFQLIGDRDE
jgi:hypothetical protein